LRQHYLPKIKGEYDEKMKADIQGKKIVVQCDEATNRKGEAVFVNLFKVLPSETSSEPKLLVSSMKNLSACTGDLQNYYTGMCVAVFSSYAFLSKTFSWIVEVKQL